MVEKYFEVAVNAPLLQTFTYKLLTHKEDHENYIGKSVKVPFGKRTAEGVILKEIVSDYDKSKIKEISEISTELLPIDPKYLEWLKWVSEYYMYPLGQTLQHVYPPLKKDGKKTRKHSVIPDVTPKDFVQLTEEQEKVVDAVLNTRGFDVHLIHGITGSGKTEVYLEVLREKLKQNQQALVLVPEISLTPQLIRRFSERFADEIAVLHSHLTDRERTNQWWSIVDEKKKILIGARSALFCPLPKPSIIIIDEEHENSFKQDEKLKYNARDCAIMLAKILDIPVILGSATPSLESWKNAIEKKYHLHTLKNRISQGGLPQIQIIDMREKEFPKDHPKWLSPELYEKIEERLKNKEQSALFLNRRGVSQVVMCRSCGDVRGCPNCDVKLSLHAKTHLVCHYCGYDEDLKNICTVCKEGEPQAVGIGTEKVEEDIKKLFPNAHITRIDRDEVQNRTELENAIAEIESGKTDILIGTQMIAKGLDFPKLTLIGVLLADIGFNMPDFRSSERSFQLLTQVAGRSGRHTKNGEVLIQTYNPEYQSLLFAKNQDYVGFADQELENRKSLSYPPYGRIALLRIQSNDLNKLHEVSRQIEYLAESFNKWKNLQVLGPAPAPIFKLKNKYRHFVLLKSNDSRLIREFYKAIDGKLKAVRGVQTLIDIDPLQTF